MSKEIEIELLSPMREGGGGTSDYNQLENKPQINGVELVGNKTTEELGIKIPTKTSDLTNDSKFVNEQFVNDAVKKETDRAVEAENGIDSSLNAHITNTNNPHQVTKEQVGLGNVDNISDKNKPVSDATQTALDGKLNKSTTVTPFPQAYTKSAEGMQSLTEISNVKTSNTLAKRDSKGKLKVADGVDNDDAATFGQMNTAVTNVDTKINNEITRATGVEDDINSKVTTIEGLIPNSASAENQLADKNFVNSSVSSVTATFRGNFATKADLDAWQTENPGVAKQNDYAIVEQDETHSNQQWRYTYQTEDGWVAQYKVNDAPFTQAQTDAINSGITKTIVDNTKSHIANKNNPHNVTKAQLGLENVDNTSDLNKPISTATQTALTHLQETMDEQISTINAAIENKQDKLTATQLEATNSGANSTNIAQISTNKTNINNINVKIPTSASSTNKLVDNTSMTNALANKQNNLSTTQLNAVNSGITSAKVTQYDGYATSKQDKLTDADLGYGLGFVDGKLSVTIPNGADKEY